MSCYQCSKKFGVFTKEHGCGNCGFGFCSKCLSFKTAVPKKDNKIINVCFKCNDLITNNKTLNDEKNNQAIYSPPKNFLKLVESNKAKSLPEPAENKQITQRLQKLQKETPPAKAIPSEQEIESRLKKLQSSDKDLFTESKNAPKASNLPMVDVEQQPEDIINRIMDEVRIEKEHGDYEQQELERLEKRLADLRANNKTTGAENLPGTTSSKVGETRSELKPLPKEIDPADALMQKFLQEAEVSLKNKEQQEDEEIWCCLCNDDATWKCIDCEDDFFCTRCYKQTHSKGEYKTHQKRPVIPPHD